MSELEKKLKIKKVRPTAMRLLVLKTLQQQNFALSLQDLETHFEKADKVTLYRTLRTFEEKGIIHSIEDGTGAKKYALCQEGCECSLEDMHVHFFCNSCKNTICLPKHGIPELNLPEGFLSIETDLLVKGVCQECTS